LALEFASITTSNEQDQEEGPKTVDQEMRNEAADELEKAIASTKLKLQGEEVDLATCHAPDDNDITRKKIADVKEVIADMEARVSCSIYSPVYSSSHSCHANITVSVG
jgi:HAT1-interacting factor 1